MTRTKEFSSPPSSKASQKNTDPHEAESAVTNKRVTQPRFAPDVGTQIRVSGAPSGNSAAPTNADPRSTLIMKPGQVAGVAAGDVASAGVAAGRSHNKPRKKYGLPGGAEQRTVIMQAEGDRNTSNPVADAAGAVAPSSHPSSKSAQPPEIELVQHEIPGDSPLDSRLILLAQPDSEQAAAFRVLRHHVLGAGHPQVIAVSGPHDGCGKTTTAINLAMALAECGRAKVLLIDANLRNPKIASIMRFVPPWCFSAQLEKHRDQPFVPWSFVEVAFTGLHVGAIDPRSEQRTRLDAPAFAVAMERLRLGPYEHIVIDCPSVIGNADVNLIQDSTDGVLLTARTKSVTARDIRTAVDQLTPTKILGTTLFET